MTERESMDIKRKFWLLYLIFVALNIADYCTTAICFLLPGFEEQNPLVRSLLQSGSGFLEMKTSIIFAMGTLGGLVYSIKKEDGLKLFNKGLIVLNAVLLTVCTANAVQLLIYFE